MNTEEKELLLKDLSARLPYWVKCHIDCPTFIADSTCVSLNVSTKLITTENRNQCEIEYVKPYLFPLSSMTEEQRKELNELSNSVEIDGNEVGSVFEAIRDCYEYSYVSIADMLTVIDWLNKNHFDYRGLIEKGLAIDATGLNIY